GRGRRGEGEKGRWADAASIARLWLLGRVPHGRGRHDRQYGHPPVRLRQWPLAERDSTDSSGGRNRRDRRRCVRGSAPRVGGGVQLRRGGRLPVPDERGGPLLAGAPPADGGRLRG